MRDRRVVTLTVKGQPPPKPRPRITRRGSFTPRPKNDNGLPWSLKIACNHRPFEGPVNLRLAFYRRTKVAVDVDNLIKFVMDEANEIAWKDDRQVVEVNATLILDALDPRTEIEISERESEDDNGTA